MKRGTHSFSISPVLLTGLFVIVLAGAISIFYYQKNVTSPIVLSVANTTPTTANTPATPPPTTATALTTLPDLKLFTSDSGYTAIYYSAGTFSTGKYAGYKRIVAVYQQEGPIGPGAYTFATKDDATYIIDSPLGEKVNIIDTGLNTTKVTTAAALANPLPADIPLNSIYTLHQNQPALVQSQDAGLTPQKFISDFSNYTALPAIGDLKVYGVTPKVFGTDFVNSLIGNKYLAGSTGVVIVDPSGIAYNYVLATTASVTAYNSEKPLVDTDANSSNPKFLTDTPPTLAFTTQAITGTPVYSSYGPQSLGTCSTDENTWIAQGITQNDLKKIGTEKGMDIYALTNPQNPINQALYAANTQNASEMGGLSDENNNTIAVPSEADYATKNPLLFVKDYWGRWALLSESQYTVPQGCGKPVVYLYPTTPTKVNVQFTGNMHLTTDIPTYHNGWSVLAQPTGQLTDLQPQFTNCAALNTTTFGSEYAAAACASKTYPYLFWAGSGSNALYPSHSDGWVISSANLNSFLNATLDSVGLTTQEKNDMLSYWLPEIQKKNAPYYKIDFLQTAEMNQIAPMAITPHPDSTFRIFLDWAPLSSKPAITPTPEKLNKVVRTGFTLVEWGGLER